MPFIPLHDKTPRILVAQPWVNWGLIAVCSLVYLTESSAGAVAFERLTLGLGMIPAALTGQASLSPELTLVPPAATLVTYQFLHGGWLHLLLNMVYLWVFGDNIEDAMGHGRYLLFYLLCGVAAGLAQIAAAPEVATPLVGASGAISGVLGAYLVLHPRARILVPVVVIPLYLPAYLLLVFWIGFQFYALAAMPSAGAGNIAWWAHIGGFFAGMILIVPFRHKAIPLWGSPDLPSGLEVTVSDARPERREAWESSKPKEQGVRNRKGRGGPWDLRK